MKSDALKRLAELVKEIKEICREQDISVYIVANKTDEMPRLTMHKYVNVEYDTTKPSETKWIKRDIGMDGVEVSYSTFSFFNTDEQEDIAV